MNQLTNYQASAVTVARASMRNALAVIVGVITMHESKKEKHYLGSLDDHTVRKSTEEMDRKLTEAHKKFKERY